MPIYLCNVTGRLEWLRERDHVTYCAKYLYQLLDPSVQFSRSVTSDSLWPHWLQHGRPPCPSPTPGVHPTHIHWIMSSKNLILCHPLLLPSIFPSIRVFSNKSALCIRWPKYWSFSFNLSPSNEHPDWSPLGRTAWISLQSKGLSSVFSNTAFQKHQLFGAQLSL